MDKTALYIIESTENGKDKNGRKTKILLFITLPPVVLRACPGCRNPGAPQPGIRFGSGPLRLRGSLQSGSVHGAAVQADW